MRALIVAALLAAAPAFAAEPAPAPAPEAPVYGPVERAVLHVAPADLAALLPADHVGLTELHKLYADFCDDVLGEDEAANTALLIDTKPHELDALTEKGMEIVRAGGQDTPAAAVFVMANARLAYADLAYSMKPTSRMKDKQIARFWELLHTEVWPTMAPVDAEARAYLTSISQGAREGSPWRSRAEDLLARMDAEKRGLAAPAGIPDPAPAPAPTTP
jgi:hypothetical protein